MRLDTLDYKTERDTNQQEKKITLYYRKRLNNRSPFLHACISYINRVHACKKSGPSFKRLRYKYLILMKFENYQSLVFRYFSLIRD